MRKKAMKGAQEYTCRENGEDCLQSDVVIKKKGPTSPLPSNQSYKDYFEKLSHSELLELLWSDCEIVLLIGELKKRRVKPERWHDELKKIATQRKRLSRHQEASRPFFREPNMAKYRDGQRRYRNAKIWVERMTTDEIVDLAHYKQRKYYILMQEIKHRGVYDPDSICPIYFDNFLSLIWFIIVTGGIIFFINYIFENDFFTILELLVLGFGSSLISSRSITR